MTKKKEGMNFRKLESVPADVRKIILREQETEKDKRGIGKFSVASTIIKIIREWNARCRESTP